MGLAPGVGALGEGGRPHVLDGLQDVLLTHDVRHGEVQAGTGEPFEIFDVGVTAHEHAVGAVGTERALQHRVQLGAEIGTGIDVLDPGAKLAQEALDGLLLGLALESRDPIVALLHPFEDGWAAGFDRAVKELPESAEGNREAVRHLIVVVVPQLAQIGALRSGETAGVHARGARRGRRSSCVGDPACPGPA